MGSSINSAFTAVSQADMPCVLAVDVIRLTFYPAYARTGNDGGRWFERCIECVTSWTDEIFTAETNLIFGRFATACTTMVSAIHNKATIAGKSVHFSPGVTDYIIAREVIKRLLVCASNELSVRNGTFLTDSIEASSIGVRLMSHVTDSIVHDRNFVVFHADNNVQQPKAPSSVVSTGVQTTPTSEQAADGGYYDISPDDSVSVANINIGRSKSTPTETYASRSEVSFRDLVCIQQELELSDRSGLREREPRRGIVDNPEYRPIYPAYEAARGAQ